MSKAISFQCQFFLISVLWGAILLVVYDVLRIARRVKKHKWFTIAAEDLLYWLIAGFFIFRLMYEQNDGIIRGFAILGMGLGMVIYNRSISGYFVEGVSKFFLFLGKQIHRLMHFVTKPFRSIRRLLHSKILKLGKAMENNGKKLIKPLKKPKKHGKLEEQTRN